MLIKVSSKYDFDLNFNSIENIIFIEQVYIQINKKLVEIQQK